MIRWLLNCSSDLQGAIAIGADFFPLCWSMKKGLKIKISQKNFGKLFIYIWSLNLKNKTGFNCLNLFLYEPQLEADLYFGLTRLEA